MVANNNTTKEKLQIEANRIEEDSLYSSKGHFYAASVWSKVYSWTGVVASILAIIAGISALKQHELLAGILAILVGALSAITTFINPNKKASMHQDAGNRYNALRNRARIFHEIDIELHSEDELLTTLKNLSKRRDKLNMLSPLIPNWAFKRARKGIEEGEADYKVDS